jgi:hypothetical protein
VHAFEAAREHIDLAERTRLRHQRQVAGIELEDDLVALAHVLEVVGAHGCQHQVDQCGQHQLRIRVVDGWQARFQREQRVARTGAGGFVQRRVEAHLEGVNE